MPRPMMTIDELELLLPKVRSRMGRAEMQYGCQGIPPMTADEAKLRITRMVDESESRLLTAQEVFLLGQLIGTFEQAVAAEALGLKGRWFCVHESGLQKIIEQL